MDARRIRSGVLLFALALTASAARAQTGVKLVLTQEFTDTKLAVIAGEAYTITGSGSLNWFTGGCPAGSTCITTPDGQHCPYTGFAAQGLPCWAMIAKVGNGTPFFVGSRLASIFTDTGELYVGVNDNYYPDNTGEWTATIGFSSTPTCEQYLSHRVTPTTGGTVSTTKQPTQLSALLSIPAPYTLKEAETACGVDDFDWQQSFIYLPPPSPWFFGGSNPRALPQGGPTQNSCAQNNPDTYPKVCDSASAPPSFQDPPNGGYFNIPNSSAQYPFYCDPRLHSFPCLEQPQPVPTTLSFLDGPTDVCLPTGTQSAEALAQFNYYCNGVYTSYPPFMLIYTALVGVRSADDSLIPLPLAPYDDGVLWVSTFNGTAGGVSAPSNSVPTDPGSGAGGVTVLMANGLPAVSGPLSYPQGVLNAASYAPNSAVSPGSIAALFGFLFVGPSVPATTAPLPLTLSGLSLQFDTYKGPLFYASAGQANIQIPWELAGQAKSILTLKASNVQGLFGEPVLIAPFSPGIFSVNGAGTGQGAIQNTSYALVDASHPASAGASTLVIYCTGLGAVTNQPATGYPAAATPLSETTMQPSVSIGGVASVPSFSGLVPGAVGLYQVNVPVPAGVASGPQVPVAITIGGVTSNTVTIAVQ